MGEGGLEEPAEQGGLAALQDEPGRVEERTELAGEVGGHDARDGARQAAAERGPLAVGEELVEDGDATAGPEHAGGLARGRLGVGDDGEQEVEQDDIERGVRQVEGVGVERADLDAGPQAVGLSACGADHAGRHVARDDLGLWREVREIEAGSAAGDQDALAGLDVGERERPATPRVEAADDGVVDRRIERVPEAVPEGGAVGHG